MDKLEKVIRGAERCITPRKCIGCPYEEFADGSDISECLNKLHKDLLELLKEKQPKKGKWLGNCCYECSVCGFNMSDMAWSIDYVEYEMTNFCPNCGADMRKDSKQE